VATAIQGRHSAPNTLNASTQGVRHCHAVTRSQDRAALAAADVKEVLTCLAVYRKVSASTQHQAFTARLFFYQYVLNKEFGQVEGVVSSKRQPYGPVL
jgi:site-specific recombinase XerD